MQIKQISVVLSTFLICSGIILCAGIMTQQKKELRLNTQNQSKNAPTQEIPNHI